MNTNTPFASKSKGKKLSVYASDGKTTKLIHFGADGYSDYTKNRDDNRKKSYIERHKTNEDWTKSGLFSAGFWSRWILWNEPTIQDSVKDVQKRFNLPVMLIKK
jgi:hypothetical protein